MAVEIRDMLQLGRLIRRARKARHLTQIDLARAAGMGERFIVDLEHGKPTCEAGRVLKVLGLLDLGLSIEPPAGVSGADLERDVARLRERRQKPRPVPNPSP